MSALIFVAYIVAILALAYVLFILPQRRRSKQTQNMLNKLEPGDEVVTAGGIFGKVTEFGKDSVQLEVARGVEMKVATRAVVRILDEKAKQEKMREALEVDSKSSADELLSESKG